MTTPPSEEEMIAGVRDWIAEAQRLFANASWMEAAEPALYEAAASRLATRWAVLERLEASRWRPITEEQRDGEVYLLWRDERDPFIGYWDDRAGWFSIAGAYAMEPSPTYYMPLSSLPSPPSTTSEDT